MAPTTTKAGRTSSAAVVDVTDDDDQPSLPQRSRPSRKYKSMKVVMRRAKRVELSASDDDDDDHVSGQMMEMDGGDGGGGNDDDCYSQLGCGKCGLGDKETEILICDKCDRGFHMFCLRPIVARVPTGGWNCPSCIGPQRNRRIRRLTQTKIIKFFGIRKCTEPMEKCASAQDIRKRRKRSSCLVLHKKSRRLLPFVPTKDPAQRLLQMGSLASALTAMNVDFSSELTYMPGMAPRSANRAKFEKGGMQVLSKEDLETVEHCNAMNKRGLCPPLIVVFDPQEGYTVEADGPIKDLTFVAEYIGDVDYLKTREHDDCDSLMTLLSAENSSKSLVICPDKRANIARFINGINNHLPESKKRQNLKCVRYDVNGECRVFLVATRDIAKGERLYYDYNGHEFEYPTHYFV